MGSFSPLGVIRNKNNRKAARIICGLLFFRFHDLVLFGAACVQLENVFSINLLYLFFFFYIEKL